MMESRNNIFQSNFLETWRINKFHGVIDISFKMRGVEFPVIHGLESRSYYARKLVRQQASDMSVTLKSPLLL